MVKMGNVVIAMLLITTSSIHAANLRQFYTHGIQNNLIIKSAQQALEGQRSHQKQAWALWLPEIEAKAGLSDSNYKFNDSSTFSGNLVTGQIADGTNVSRRASLEFVAAKQRIFDIPSFRMLQMAGKEKLISELVYQYEKEKFLYKLTELYLKALAAREAINTALSFKDSTSYALRLAKKSYELELTTIDKYYNAQAKYQESLKDVMEAKQQYTEALTYLNQFTQTDYKSVDLLKPDVLLHLPDPQKKQHWINEGYNKNVGLKINALKLQVERLAYKKTLGKYLPTMDLEAMAFHGSDFFPTPATFAFIGLANNFKYQGETVVLNFKLPIYAGGANMQKAKEAAFNVQKLILKNRNDRQLLKLNISMMYDNLFLYKQEIKQAKLQVRTNEKIVRIKKTMLNLQKGTYNDYIDSVTEYKRSLQHYSQARNEYIDTVIKIHKATGTLTPVIIDKISRLMA